MTEKPDGAPSLKTAWNELASTTPLSMWQEVETRCVAQAAFSDQDPPLRPWHRRNRLLQRCSAAAVVIRLARLGSTFNNIDIDTRIDNTTERPHH